MMDSKSQSASEPGERHAFVLDDEQQIRKFVSRALISTGFIPHEFSSIAEVEAALTQVKPEVIVLDLSLAGSDAVEMMRSLMASRYGGKVLLVSGHDPATLEEVRSIGQRLGLVMLPALRKPFRLEGLKASLAAAIEPPPVSVESVDLEAAFRNNWLELWYQPKVDLGTMTVCGAEALIRLRHPVEGVIAPANFLPPPGDPLNQPLTDFVVRRALADWSSFAAWPSLDGWWASKRLAINVPASILQGADFVKNLRRHLPRHPRFPGLIVEITENEAVSDPDLAREVAVQLKLYNVHVSIDDFGAGYSTFARLKELPFAELKLDRSYVKGCAEDSGKRTMCQSVVDLAHDRRLTAVAEGVETADDLQTLVDMGYDAAQGFFFAKPMDSGSFARMLTAPPSIKPAAS
jgi:EAL domain-containing protein (putative c-di-GMP-specific phosphodiesterase class I)/CheY-like chemotaxis protein